MIEPMENRDYVVVPTYDELQARIRELEAEWGLQKIRIRELERQLREFTPEDIRGMAYDTNALLEGRIAKAKAILEAELESYKSRNWTITDVPIEETLAVLEGK